MNLDHIPADAEPARPGLAVYARCCQALLATPARLLAPRRRDATVLARITDAGMPRAAAQVRLTVLPQSSYSAPTAIVAEGAWRPLQVGIGYQTFLVEHPKARFLVDPALCSDFDQVLEEMPRFFRRAVRPRGAVLGLADALDRVTLDVADIDFVLPTHIHWDHISGVLELPERTPLQVSRIERDWAVTSGPRGIHVPTRPLAGRRLESYELDGPPVLTFEHSHDLFGDGSVVIVDMPGHTPGSVGILLALENNDRVLLAGDAIWHNRQAELIRQKAPFPGLLADFDRDAAFATIHRIHALPRDLVVIPSHDHRAASSPWVSPAIS